MPANEHERALWCAYYEYKQCQRELGRITMRKVMLLRAVAALRELLGAKAGTEPAREAELDRLKQEHSK